MDSHSKNFFKKLMLTPGISGFEERARRLWAGEVKGFADAVETDVNGSAIATINGKSARTSILLLGHIDQLGLIVRYIDDNGFIYFSTVGTFDLVTLVSQRVTILGPKGDVPAVVGRSAIHLQQRDERNKHAVKLEDLYLDMGATSKAEAAEYAPVGTPIQIGHEYVELLNNRFAARVDNRFGTFVVAEVMRRLWEKKSELYPTVHGAATVQEETSIGFTGAATVAYRVMPSAAIAIDVNQSVDTPGVDKRIHGDARMTGGPILNVGVMSSNKLVEAIKAAAKAAGIELQYEYNNSRTWSDADAMPGLRTGVPTVYFGMPLRYMHNTTEVGDFRDIDQCIDVLVAYILSMRGEVDYTP